MEQFIVSFNPLSITKSEPFMKKLLSALLNTMFLPMAYNSHCHLLWITRFVKEGPGNCLRVILALLISLVQKGFC